MSGIDRPLYLVTMKDQWATHKALLGAHNAVPAFGTRADAEAFMRETAAETHTPVRYYKIVEFVFADMLVGR